MIKYSVTLSGLLGLQDVTNIFISLPALCSKFATILVSKSHSNSDIITNRYTCLKAQSAIATLTNRSLTGKNKNFAGTCYYRQID